MFRGVIRVRYANKSVRQDTEDSTIKCQQDCIDDMRERESRRGLRDVVTGIKNQKCMVTVKRKNAMHLKYKLEEKPKRQTEKDN